jgi:squalene-hopene/tetraprenyl-beta-curcumene cyclase
VHSQAFPSRLEAALARARQELLAARAPGGHWVGELSPSALSTATAICALAMVERHSTLPEAPHSERRIASGLDWLARTANPDGGWGDTTLSLSNISTTALCWASFGSVPGADEKYRSVVAKAEAWLTRSAGGITPELLVPAIIQRYGKDRTFSVPILTMCTLAGRLGDGAAAWRWVLPLPFELAACPHHWFAALRLPVVSYALPALIAIGQARHHHLPSRNPVARLLRNLTRTRTLEVLQSIQPSSGGFLEATPLTSFVVMSLAASGQVENPVTKKGVEFLLASARRDGSWPIDTNLATWVTTLSLNALGGGSGLDLPAADPNTTPAHGPTILRVDERRKIRDWLLGQQYREKHPYTDAAPGGWAWTDLPGGVPDADDTAGALLGLRSLQMNDERTRPAVINGIHWLLGLQNRDGGMPTFCRGWGALPFDRSSPDLTAHALRAWLAWLGDVPSGTQARARRGMTKALDYLAGTQRADGSWIPLWFGNQFAPGDENPTYGTARVLPALTELAAAGFSGAATSLSKGTEWLLSAQKKDGSWGGFIGGPSSIEESALALEALAGLLAPAISIPAISADRVDSACQAGALWLIDRVESGAWKTTAPIGFYFAKLWYYERLYPLIFTVGALEKLAAGGSRKPD